MPRKQTRRSISMRREVFEDLKAWCTANNIPMSRKLEELVKLYLESKRPIGGGFFQA